VQFGQQKKPYYLTLSIENGILIFNELLAGKQRFASIIEFLHNLYNVHFGIVEMELGTPKWETTNGDLLPGIPSSISFSLPEGDMSWMNNGVTLLDMKVGIELVIPVR
jgi:hypothetical protein